MKQIQVMTMRNRGRAFWIKWRHVTVSLMFATGVHADTLYDFGEHVPEIYISNISGSNGIVEFVSGPIDPSNSVLRMDHGGYGIWGQVFASITIPESGMNEDVVSVQCSVFVEEGAFNTFAIGLGENDNPEGIISWSDFGVIISFTGYDGIRVRMGDAYMETDYSIVPRGRWFDVLIIANEDIRRYGVFIKSSDDKWVAITSPETATTSSVSDYLTLDFRNGEAYELKEILLVTSEDARAYYEFPLHDWFIDNLEILDDIDGIEDDFLYQWRGYQNHEGWVHLEDWIGWVSIAQSPWIWSTDVGWIYMPEEENLKDAPGTWGYFYK